MQKQRISIHAPARGATVVSILTCPSNSYFNPRSREGSDVCFRVYERLSIYFNPRSREGSDNVYYEYSKYRGISIHAPARGATIASSPLSSGLIQFQSTLPRGERLFPTFFYTSVRIISIHAPARGATNFGAIRSTSFTISIHAPARGATQQAHHYV